MALASVGMNAKTMTDRLVQARRLMAGVDRVASRAAGEFRAAGSRQSPPQRKLFGELVGHAFFLPMLRMMRSAVIRGPYLHGGRGGEAFAAQFDQLIAERLGQRCRLTDAIYERFRDKSGAR